jgi:hypothetical protein
VDVISLLVVLCRKYQLGPVDQQEETPGDSGSLQETLPCIALPGLFFQPRIAAKVVGIYWPALPLPLRISVDLLAGGR